MKLPYSNNFTIPVSWITIQLTCYPVIFFKPPFMFFYIMLCSSSTNVDVFKCNILLNVHKRAKNSRGLLYVFLSQ